MARKERVHECFEVWAPPLGKSVTNFPVRVRIRGSVLRGKTFVQPGFETADFVGGGGKVIAWPVSWNGQLRANRRDRAVKVSQFEERICDLQH